MPTPNYADLFDSCQITPAHLPEIDGIIATILAHRGVYEAIETATGVPWFALAAVHAREASLGFDKWLANGDPLSHATVDVPAGLTVPGFSPPYPFKEAAILSVQKSALNQIGIDTPIAHLLAGIERFNGAGYQHHGINTPYLWSYTNHYTSGLFTGDHIYDAEAVNKEAGAAAIILRMYDTGKVDLLGEPVTVHFPAVTPPVGTQDACPAFVLRGSAFVGIRAAAANLGAMLDVSTGADGHMVATVTRSGHPASKLSITTIGSTGYCRAKSLAVALGLSVSFDAATDVLAFT